MCRFLDLVGLTFWSCFGLVRACTSDLLLSEFDVYVVLLELCGFIGIVRFC